MDCAKASLLRFRNRNLDSNELYSGLMGALSSGLMGALSSGLMGALSSGLMGALIDGSIELD